jgi:hypothetical protein
MGYAYGRRTSGRPVVRRPAIIQTARLPLPPPTRWNTPARGKAKGMRWCCRRFPERALAISSRLPGPAAAGPCGPIIGICRATPQKHDIRLSFSGALHAMVWSSKSSASADLTGVGVTDCDPIKRLSSS